MPLLCSQWCIECNSSCSYSIFHPPPHCDSDVRNKNRAAAADGSRRGGCGQVHRLPGRDLPASHQAAGVVSAEGRAASGAFRWTVVLAPQNHINRRDHEHCQKRRRGEPEQERDRQTTLRSTVSSRSTVALAIVVIVFFGNGLRKRRSRCHRGDGCQRIRFACHNHPDSPLRKLC